MVDTRYYTPQEAAETLSCDDEQILSWIHSGELPAINVAKSTQQKRPRWRIAESDLGKFLLARRHPASMKPVAPKTAKRTSPPRYV